MVGKPLRQAGYFLRNQRWSFIWYPEPDQALLYEVDSDPMQERDVSAEHEGQVRSFKSQIEEWIDDQD